MIVAAATEDGTRHLIYSSDEGVSEALPIGDIKEIGVEILPQEYLDKFYSNNLGMIGHSEQCAVHVVVSVASGTRQAEQFYSSRLVPVFEILGLVEGQNYTLHVTTSDASITELTTKVFAPSIQEGVKQIIILLSGDGGVIDIVNALMRCPKGAPFTEPVIALIPLGTGNALAHSTKVTADNTMGLSALSRGQASALPIFKASFSPGSRLLTNEGNDAVPLDQNDSLWGCVVASWGFHASLVADSDTTEYRKHGAARFQMAAKENLYPSNSDQPHSYTGLVSVRREKEGKWEKIDRKDHAYVLATFASNLEKTFTISPFSKPLDGQLRLVHFGHMAADDVMDIMKAAYDGGKHVDDERVSYESIEELRIDFEEDDERWRRMCIDGKIVRVEKGGWVEVTKEERHCLNVMYLE